MTMISVVEKYMYNVGEKNQTIQGFHIEDTDVFWAVESAVHSSVMEGWQPTKADIVDAYRVATEYQPEMESDFRRIFGEKT